MTAEAQATLVEPAAVPASEVPEVTVVRTPAAPPVVKRLDDLDQAKLQNLQLRHENLNLQLGILAEQRTRIEEKKERLTEEMKVLRIEVAKKYDVHPETLMIRRDGVIE